MALNNSTGVGIASTGDGPTSAGGTVDRVARSLEGCAAFGLGSTSMLHAAGAIFAAADGPRSLTIACVVNPLDRDVRLTVRRRTLALAAVQKTLGVDEAT